MTVLLLGSLIILLTTGGQILLKLGASKPGRKGLFNTLVAVGYFIFILVVLLSYYLMGIMPMKNFTVIMSLTYIAVALAARLVFREQMSRTRIAGTLLIAAGVYVFLSG